MSDQYIDKPGGMQMYPPCQPAEEKQLEEAKSDEDPGTFFLEIGYYIFLDASLT